MRRLTALAAPIVGINVLNVLVLAIDTAMVGRLDNADQLLTALGFAIQVVWLLMVAMIGLTVGTVALIARAYGAGDHARVDHVLRQATQLTVLLSLVIAAVGNLAAPQLLYLLGASPAAIESGLDYLRPLLTGVVFTYLLILYGAVLRGVGNTRVPFLVSLFSTTLNVAFNWMLIYGNLGMPALGLTGAAVGTVCAHFVGSSLLGLLLNRGVVERLKLSFKLTAIDRELARAFARIGTPAALDTLVFNASFLSIVSMLGRVDELAVAAHGIGIRVQSLAFVPGLAFSQATGALVGQSLGAGSVDGARQVARASVILCTALMSLLALAFVVFAEPMVTVFHVEPGTELAKYTVDWIQILGYCMPAVGWYIALIGLLQGAGDTQTGLNINLLGTFLFQIPASYVFGFVFDWGAFGIWVAFPLSCVLKVILVHRAYLKGTWATTGIEA